MAHRLFHAIRSSMSAKVALIVTVPVAILTFSYSYHHYQHDNATAFRNAESQLLRVSEGIKGPAEMFILNYDFVALQHAVADSAGGADINAITVVDTRGMVVACSKEGWVGKRYTEMLLSGEMTENDVKAVQKALGGGYSVYFDPLDVHYCLAMPLLVNGERIGAAFISLDLSSVQSQIKRGALENSFVSAAGTFVLAVTIYFLFYHLFTRRIKAVSMAAERFARGDMSVRAEEQGTDEVGYLATSFNVLAEDITNWRTNLEDMAASRMNELLVLFDVVNTINQSLELSTVLPKVLDSVTHNMGIVQGAIALVGSDGKTFSLAAHRGLSEESIRQITTAGRGGLAEAILGNRAVRASATDAGEESALSGLGQDQIRSAVAVPISTRGSVFGAMALYSRRQDMFNEQHESLLANIGNQLSVAVLNARLYEKTLAMAREDGLTGLANRRHFMEILKQEIYRAERYHTALSIMILDLDKFKSFNDTYGHLKGDELLREFSALIRSMVRESDVAGRYGGEEFAIMLPNTPLRGGTVIAERIRSAVEALKIDAGEGKPPAGRTASIGIAEFQPGDDAEKLLGRADAALYRAKQTGRNRIVW